MMLNVLQPPIQQTPFHGLRFLARGFYFEKPSTCSWNFHGLTCVVSCGDDDDHGWMGLHIHETAPTTGVTFHQTHQKMKNWILLDSESTVSSFCNKNLVKNIREAKNPLNLTTTAGSRTITKAADVNGFGEVWYDDDTMTNIFSLAKLETFKMLQFSTFRHSHKSISQDFIICQNCHHASYRNYHVCHRRHWTSSQHSHCRWTW